MLPIIPPSLSVATAALALASPLTATGSTVRPVTMPPTSVMAATVPESLPAAPAMVRWIGDIVADAKQASAVPETTSGTGELTLQARSHLKRVYLDAAWAAQELNVESRRSVEQSDLVTRTLIAVSRSVARTSGVPDAVLDQFAEDEPVFTEHVMLIGRGLTAAEAANALRWTALARASAIGA